MPAWQIPTNWNAEEPLYWDTQLNKMRDEFQFLYDMLHVSAESKIISSGTLTVTAQNGYVTVSPESGDSDDLATISGLSNGDMVALIAAAGMSITVKHGTGNLVTPDGADMLLSANYAYIFRYNGTDCRVVGGGGAGGGGLELAEVSAYLNLGTSYADLVAEPAGGVRKVKEISMTNEDASVTTDFWFKIVKSSTDYFIFKFTLAPGEKFILEFPIYLDSTMKIQAKITASATGRATAAYLDVSKGATAVVNFTGTSFTDLATVASGKTYTALGFAMCSTDTSTQDCSWRYLTSGAAVRQLNTRTLPPSSSYFSEAQVVLTVGEKCQVAHGAASKTGSALISYEEV
jgi:hypothetical protein